ncbi:MAG: patatin-like phospholipase family protein [Beijerinckiaceae bacterium]
MFIRNIFDVPGEGKSGGGALPPREPKIGVALGAGAARGWSHIGVLRELAAHGIVPSIVAGTSIGAVVGGCYAADRLEALEFFARSLTKRRVLSLMDFSFSGVGLLAGSRLRKGLEEELSGRHIETLPKTFAVVATEIGTGHEVWLRKGNLVEAIRASYALPGIFEPVKLGGRWLFDGALVNPVPVNVCRALGADVVIAVNLVGDNAFRGTVISDQLSLDRTLRELDQEASESRPSASGFLRGVGGNMRRHFGRRADGAPGIANAMMVAFNITQDRISRSRLAGDPPDVLINARNSHIGLFDFHRADELIAIGREAVRRSLSEIADYVVLVSNNESASTTP